MKNTGNNNGNTLGNVGFGFAIGDLVLELLRGGGLNNLFGCGQPKEPVATQRDIDNERRLNEAHEKIVRLEADRHADEVALAVERRVSDKLDVMFAQQNAINMKQVEFNTRGSDLLAQVKGQADFLASLTSPYINQNVFSASQAAYSALKGGASGGSGTTGN